MKRKTGRGEGKICCRPEVVQQEKSEEGIFRKSSPKSFQSQCPPPINPMQGTLVKHQVKATQKVPTLLQLPASAFCLSYPFLPERQILKVFSAQPPTQGKSPREEAPVSFGGNRTGTGFLSEQRNRRVSRKIRETGLGRGLKRHNLVATLTRVRHGDDLIAGPWEVKDDGSRRPSLISQMDLVCEGAAPSALDEGQPRDLNGASPVPRDRGHREIRVRVTGIERPWPVGRYQDPSHWQERRILAVHALLAQLPHGAVHSGVRNPPGHVEVRGPHSFGSPGAGGLRTQGQQEAPRQQPGKAAAPAVGDPGPGRWPHGARVLRFPRACDTRPPRWRQDLGLDQVRARWGGGGETLAPTASSG